MSKHDKTLSKPIVYVLIALVVLSSIFAIMMFGPGTGPSNSLFDSSLRYYTKGTEELYYVDYAQDIIQNVREMGVELTGISSEYSIFLDQVMANKEYDMAIIELEGDTSPHLEFLFGEGTSNNIFNFENIMDGNITKNLLGNITIETDFNARRTLLYQLQEHLMTNVLPMVPLFTPVRTFAYWDNIEGFVNEIGIAHSLPYMTFNGLHEYQDSTDILYIGAGKWFDLNPLTLSEDAEELIVSLMMDKLIELDEKGTATKLGLVDNWGFEDNYTTLLLHIRDSIDWQSDVDGLFPSEVLTVDDVVFTLDLYTNSSSNPDSAIYNWIENYEVYNSSTVAIYIDSDSTRAGRQPYGFALEDLAIYPYPSYYLTDENRWTKYKDSPFGTGKYYFNSTESQVDLAAVMYKFENWHGNGMIDGMPTNLAFDQIEIQMYEDSYTMNLALQEGRLDLADFKKSPIIEDAIPVDDFKVEFKLENSLIFIAFNLKNDVFGGVNNFIATNETGVSKALAIRKAIASVIQKSLTNSRLHNGHYNLTDTPLPYYYSDYYYSSVTKYPYSIDAAIDYLKLAGFNISSENATDETSFSLVSTVVGLSIVSPISVLIINRKKKQVKLND